jgi:hypothetical protein
MKVQMNAFDRADEVVRICTCLVPFIVTLVIVIFAIRNLRKKN